MQTIELARVIAPAILFVMMMGMGLGLRRQDFVNLVKTPTAAIVGLVGQVVVLPVLGVAVALLFKLEPALALGVVILSLCPGGIASNTISFLIKGDVALSISLTIVSSCIAFFSVPLLSGMALSYWQTGHEGLQLPMTDTVIKLFVITIIPLALGMALAKRLPQAAQRLESPLRIVGFSFLMLMVLSVLATEFQLIYGFIERVGLALLVLFGSCMGLAYAGAKLTRLHTAQVRAITVEIGIQNSALALVIASLLGSVDVAVPAILYSVVVCLCAVLGVCVFWLAGHRRSVKQQGHSPMPER